MNELNERVVEEMRMDEADAGGSAGDAAGVEQDAPSARAGVVLDELARLPDKAILDEAALAKALHVAPRTLRRMVNRWQVPPGVRLGGRSVWFAGRVLAFIEAGMIRAERDAEKNAKRFRELST